MYKLIRRMLIPVLIHAFGFAVTAGAEDIIWDDRPASKWEQQAYPLGNGELGCMVFGGVEKERIQFNQDTLWVGSEKNTGTYQNFGDILISFREGSGADAAVPSGRGQRGEYRRELDISRAVLNIAYGKKGSRFKREYFASNPAGVIVFRYTAEQPGALSGTISLRDAHGVAARAENKRISISGKLGKKHQNYRRKSWPEPIMLDYEAQLLVLNEGGTLEADGGSMEFSGCDGLTLLLAADTDFVMQREKGWKGEHPHERVTAAVDAAAKRPYGELLAEHVRDYQSLFSRVVFDRGESDPDLRNLPLRMRLQAYRQGASDPDLEELLFQYARYLIISCSRPGCAPCNLQGLWNKSNNPPWRCDYHSDVNTQMHYWFVDHANLSECFDPLTEWLCSIREVRREETLEHFGKRGIAMHAENGLFGGSTWKWSIGDMSWLLNNLYDHYRYTLDEDYLKTRVYPLMTDLYQFWEDHLEQRPAPDGDGSVLLAPDGFSPEHGPHEDGVSFDQQLAWDLLNNFAEASEILGVDADKRAKARRMRDRLLGPQIGSWGQLQEWMVDRDKPKDHHRHVSHLIALHPGRQISPVTTPELAEAARVSLNARGDGGTGWSKAWKINFWARLHDGDRAYKLLREMMRGNVNDNLFDTHPPFQIDGNFGYASGVCEMLLQSHMGFIHLLPALPSDWRNGKLSGIKARGGFMVDLDWKDGVLARAVISSQQGGDAMVRYGDKVIQIRLGKGESKVLGSDMF